MDHDDTNLDRNIERERARETRMNNRIRKAQQELQAKALELIGAHAQALGEETMRTLLTAIRSGQISVLAIAGALVSARELASNDAEAVEITRGVVSGITAGLEFTRREGVEGDTSTLRAVH